MPCEKHLNVRLCSQIGLYVSLHWSMYKIERKSYETSVGNILFWLKKKITLRGFLAKLLLIGKNTKNRMISPIYYIFVITFFIIRIRCWSNMNVESQCNAKHHNCTKYFSNCTTFNNAPWGFQNQQQRQRLVFDENMQLNIFFHHLWIPILCIRGWHFWHTNER